MTVRVLAASLSIAWFAACAAPPPLPGPEVETATDTSEVIVPPTMVRMIAPTPAQLDAALSGDAAAMARAITNDACMASSSCPAEFGSCANWSGSTECDFQCGPGICKCIFTQDGDCEPEIRGHSTFNSYRVCFDVSGNPCTEWRQTFSFFCGC